MKAQIRVGNNYVTGEGDTPLEVFKQVAALTEVFGETECRKCHGTDLQYVVRNATDGKKQYIYPEVRCNNLDCRAKLSFGQSEDGVIYPKRYKMEGKEVVVDKNGKKEVLGSWGWRRYNKDTGEEE